MGRYPRVTDAKIPVGYACCVQMPYNSIVNSPKSVSDANSDWKTSN